MGTAGFQMKVYGTLNFLLTAARKIQLVSSDRSGSTQGTSSIFTKWQEGCLTISEEKIELFP